MLNFDNVGKKLAIIDGGKLNNKIISVSDDEDNKKIKKSFNRYKIVDNGKFQQLPNTHSRTCAYITGPSGAGKSCYIANYAKQYKKIYKENPIYVFSALKEDESLDVIEPKRIKIDSRLITDPLDINDFSNSLIIFDDIDVISDKNIRLAVYNILDQVLEIGRHNFCSCFLSSHLPYNGASTKRILNECSTITYFPSSGNSSTMKRLLCEIVGIDKKDISNVKKLKSRWCTIFKNYPQIIMTEKNIYLTSDEDL
jgi:hypothetical protein